eukprot:233004-Hanusia_phi.AAC.2
MVGRDSSALTSSGRSLEEKIRSYRRVAKGIIDEDNELLREVYKDVNSSWVGRFDRSLDFFQGSLDEQRRTLDTFKHAVKCLVDQKWKVCALTNSFSSWQRGLVVPPQVRKMSNILSRKSNMGMCRRVVSLWSRHAFRSRSVSLAVRRKGERARRSRLISAFASWRDSEQQDLQPCEEKKLEQKSEKTEIAQNIASLCHGMHQFQDELDQLAKNLEAEADREAEETRRLRAKCESLAVQAEEAESVRELQQAVVPELLYVDKIQQLQRDLDSLTIELQQALQGKKTLEEELKTCRQYLNRKSEELGELLKENRDDLEKAGAAVAAAELAAQTMSRLRSERVAWDELVYWKRECATLKNEISSLAWERRICWWMKESKSCDSREDELRTACYRLIKMLTTKDLQIELLFQRHHRVLRQANDAFELLNERFVVEFGRNRALHAPREREYIIAECKDIVKDFHVRFGKLLRQNEKSKYSILAVIAESGDENAEYDALSKELPLAPACRDFFKTPHLRSSMDLVRKELNALTTEISQVIQKSQECLVGVQKLQEKSPAKHLPLACDAASLPVSRETEILNLSRDVTQVKRQESPSDSRLQVENMLDSMMGDMADHEEQSAGPAELIGGRQQELDVEEERATSNMLPDADLQQRVFSVQRAFSLLPAIQEILKEMVEEAGRLRSAPATTREENLNKMIEKLSAGASRLPVSVSSSLDDLEEVLQLQKLRILAIMEEETVDIDFLLGELIHVQKECLRMEGIIEDCRIECARESATGQGEAAGPQLAEISLRLKVARGVDVLAGELEAMKRDVGRMMAINEGGEELQVSPVTARHELPCLRCEDLQGALEEAEERAAALEQEVQDLSHFATKFHESRQLSETLNRQLANLDNVLNEVEEDKVELAHECQQLREENRKLIHVNSQLQTVNSQLMDKLDKKVKR